MLKSSDFVRAYTEEFKQKCAISAIPIAFAKFIGICSPIAQHCYYGNIKKKNKEEQKNLKRIFVTTPDHNIQVTCSIII